MAHDKVYGICDSMCQVSIDENWHNENLVPNLGWFANSVKLNGIPIGINILPSQYIDNKCVRLVGGDVTEKSCTINLKTIEFPITITLLYGANNKKSYVAIDDSPIIDSEKNMNITIIAAMGRIALTNNNSSGNIDIYGIKIERGSIPTTYVKSNETLKVANDMVDNIYNKLKDLVVVKEVYNQSLTLDGNASQPLTFPYKSGYKCIALGACYCGGTDTFRFAFDQNVDVGGSTDRVWVINTSANSKTLNTKIQLVYLKNLS